MKLFSNGQFDVDGAVYIFNQKNKKFQKFPPKKIAKEPMVPVFLEYSSEPFDNLEKRYELKLIVEGKQIGSTLSGSLFADYGNGYESNVKEMIRRANGICEANKDSAFKIKTIFI